MKLPKTSSIPVKVRDGRMSPIGLDRSVPLLHQGKRVGTVDQTGAIVLPDRQNSWPDYLMAGQVDRLLAMNGATKVFSDGEIVAVVVAK